MSVAKYEIGDIVNYDGAIQYRVIGRIDKGMSIKQNSNYDSLLNKEYMVENYAYFLENLNLGLFTPKYKVIETTDYDFDKIELVARLDKSKTDFGDLKFYHENSFNQVYVNIKSIFINPEKKIVTVVFNDGEYELVKCHKDDELDPVIGTALGIARHIFGSNNQFKKFVKQKAKVMDKK